MPLGDIGRTAILAAALLLLGVGGAVGQQEAPETGPAPEAAPPDGTVRFGLATGRQHFLSGLPATYLDGLSLRRVSSDADLDDGRGVTARLGVRLVPRLTVEGEYVMADSEYGLANIEADVRYWGVNALYSLPWDLFAVVGAGSVAYDFQASSASRVPRYNRDFALNVGIGARTESVLGSPFAMRAEIRDYVSWFTVPGVDTRVQHHLATTYGFEVSFP